MTILDQHSRNQARSAEEREQMFYDGALRRITRFGAVLLVAGIPVLAVRFGALPCLGWMVGGLISCYNFHSLSMAVNALGERIVAGRSRESGGRIVAKFLLRYALFALGAYAIFRISVGSLYGMLAGLFLPVLATLCEAVCETYVALRRAF